MTTRPGPPHLVVPGSVGVLGGTFDPIHLGHLAIAEEAREALGLERVLFVPAGEPVHKPGRRFAPVEDRVAMVELAIRGEPAFELSRAEVDRPGPSFAVDTLEGFAAAARAEGREPDLTFILSADTYAGLPTWREPDRILVLCRMAVLPRPGAPGPDPGAMARLVPGADRRTVLLDGPLLAVSGSTIRARVAAGRSIRYLVPDAVAAYIGDHGLYAEPPVDREPADDLRRNATP